MAGVFEELKRRGLLAQLTDEEEIRELVNSGKAVFYIGFDPTADSLHVGHFMALCLMKRLQEAGNKPIALIGGGTAVIGGDTKPGPGVISCTAIGDMEGRRPMMRNGANPGDVVAITGALGGPAAGFAALENGIDAEDAIFSLMTPVPMVKEGMALSGCGKITSCIDLSDGLATAANTICEQSRCGMEIVWEFLPVSPDVDEVCLATRGSEEDMVLNWGGEYELMFTFPKVEIGEVQRTGIFFSLTST